MIRTFVVAFVTTVAVSMGLLEAQSTGAPAQGGRIPVSVVGGTPGVTIEFFMDAGKLADATVNATGGVDWVLDIANKGKTRVQIYVDVCKDGKIVKVMFVTGSGAPPPKDEDCDRRIAAVSFQSDCGVTQITLNFANFGANVIGCGGLSIRDPKILGTIGGGLIGALVLFRGDDGPTAVAAPVQLPVTVVTPPIAPVNTTTPAPAPPQAPVEFTVTIPVGSWTHPTGSNTSLVCTVVVTTPAQPGAQWTATVQGPFVVPGQNFSGTLNARGQAEIRASISNVGSYTFTVTVVSGGVSRSGTSNSINVTFFNNNCPAAQTSLAPS